MKYEMVVFDLDGTLLDSNFELTEETIGAVHGLRELGLRVSVATGRGYGSAEPFLERLGIIEPMVFSNGAVFDNPETGEREVIAGVPLESALIAMMLLDLYPDISAKAHMLGGEVLKSNATVWPHEGTHFAAGEVCENIKAALLDDPIKIVFFGPELRLMEFKTKLLAILGNRAPAKLFQSQPYYLEMVNGKTSKGLALLKLIQALELDPQKVVTVGDQENDFDMLRLFGLGIRVGNGHKSLAEVARYQVKEPQAGGVVEILEILRQELST
ncbi:MAG: HAD family hydrolase [bacterium]|nr:HAD family hydrolase [bacterium]